MRQNLRGTHAMVAIKTVEKNEGVPFGRCKRNLIKPIYFGGRGEQGDTQKNKQHNRYITESKEQD